MAASSTLAGSRIVAVRPYATYIRSRVFRVLARLGVAPREGDAIAAGTPDDDVLERLRHERCAALLVPFHAHADRDGRRVHGIDLIARIRSEVSAHARTPVLCPISKTGRAAAELLIARHPRGTFDGVLFLYEDELDRSDVGGRVGAFLLAHVGVPGQ